MRVRTKITVAVLVVAALAALFLVPRHILAPRLVARVVTPNGIELCVVQETSLDSLPWFTTSLVCRKPGGSWERFYFHHEDDYWGASRVTVDTNSRVATFYRRGVPAIAFAWATGAYTNLQRGRTGAPQPMPVGWSPELSVFSDQ